MKAILFSIGKYVLGGVFIGGGADGFAADAGSENVDRELRSVLSKHEFTRWKCLWDDRLTRLKPSSDVYSFLIGLLGYMVITHVPAVTRP